VESITIVAERNPNPVIAHYRLTPRLLPYLATRVRLADSGEVQALVKAEGGIHRATRDVAVAISGCGDSEPGPAPLAAQARPEGISIRTKREDDALTVRVLFSHPMDPPGRDPAGGPPVSGHYIQEVTAELNGETLLNGDWSAGVSRDPYLAFKILKARPGDIVRLSWSDTAGNCGSAEALVG
jgi:sulfur-oxidizing protein SoxZ